MIRLLLLSLITLLTFVLPAGAKQIIEASKITNLPVIDGDGDDLAWKSAKEYVVRDSLAEIPIDLQVAYTNELIFLKVRFPDQTENRRHKMLEWNPTLNIYETGPLREDSFVIKWSMEPIPTDITLHSQSPYRADIWFWKAFRTDPLGYADDKIHIYSRHQERNAKRIVLDNGQTMFLLRLADEGKSSYQSIANKEYIGNSVVRYKHRQPIGSRADVRAKGKWSKGFWTIEFQRRLRTNNSDDLQFTPDFSFYFGLSRYEIGGKPINRDIEQPHYESGEIGEILELTFKK